MINKCDFLDSEYPIIQSPMAGVQDYELALAVSKGGGLGSLPCAMLSHTELAQQLDKISAQTNKPINLNFFCHQLPTIDTNASRKWQHILRPYFDELGLTPDLVTQTPQRVPFSHDIADVIEAYKPKIMSFHFGLPEKTLLNRVKSWGTKILCTATTIEEAKWLEANGVDAIIIQGLEAGGHRGSFLTKDTDTQTDTFSLLSQALTQTKLPLIAAGGIASEKDVYRAIELGASAVQIGTTYLLCTESKASNIHKNAILKEHKTILTNVISGRLARGIPNRLVNEIGPINDNALAFPNASTLIAALKNKAEQQGLNDFSTLWCGENTSGCRDISATQLTKELAKQLSF